MQVATDLNEWPASYSLWKYDFRGRIWISFSENFRTGHLICCCWQINQTITSTPHTIFCCSLGARLISTRLLEKFFRGVVIRSIPPLVALSAIRFLRLHYTTRPLCIQLAAPRANQKSIGQFACASTAGLVHDNHLEVEKNIDKTWNWKLPYCTN